MATRENELVLDIEGMTCASCVQKIERALGRVADVDDAVVNLATRTATVRSASADVDALITAIQRAGYGARAHTEQRSPDQEYKGFLRRFVLGAVLTVPVLVTTFVFPDFRWSPEIAWTLTTPVVFWAGWPFFRGAFRAARHRTTTMDTLVAIGSFAAYGYSAWSVATGMHEHYFDTAAVIVTLILLGKTLEARARSGATDAARALLERNAEGDGVGEAVLVSLGPAGAILVQPSGDPLELPAAPVRAVDTVGAGDALNGALAAGLAAGMPLPDAARRAVRAAGLAVTRQGAREGMPTAAELDERSTGES